MTAVDQNVRVFVMIDPLPTSPNTSNPNMAIARGICHLVVGRLPDAALPELLDSLKAMFEFYTESPRQVAPPTIKSSLPSPRRARLTPPRQRPSFQIEEE